MPPRRRRDPGAPALAEALVDAAELAVRDRGPHAFSLAEAARGLGVSISAPYRHYSDREDLLAAVAARGHRRLATVMAAAVAGASGTQERVLAAAEAYLRFAAEDRPVFLTMFAAGVRKERRPELAEAAASAGDVVAGAVRALAEKCGVDRTDRDGLILAVSVMLHGFATLTADGHFGPGPDGLAVATSGMRDSVRRLLTTAGTPAP